MQVLYLGRAPSTKETLPDFHEKCRVTRHSRVFRELTGSQRIPGFGASQEVAEWKWEPVTMDFVTHLPRTPRMHDEVWVIVDRLTKSAHFLVVRMTFTLEEFCWLYIREIVRLHGVSVSIVSDRDPRFMVHFYKSFQKAMGTRLMMSTAFHL